MTGKLKKPRWNGAIKSIVIDGMRINGGKREGFKLKILKMYSFLFLLNVFFLIESRNV